MWKNGNVVCTASLKKRWNVSLAMSSLNGKSFCIYVLKQLPVRVAKFWSLTEVREIVCGTKRKLFVGSLQFSSNYKFIRSYQSFPLYSSSLMWICTLPHVVKHMISKSVDSFCSYPFDSMKSHYKLWTKPRKDTDLGKANIRWSHWR